MTNYMSHVKVDDDLFGITEYIDIEEQRQAGAARYAFEPLAVVFNINNDDNTADYAVIRGSLRGRSAVDDWTLRIGEIHELRFNRIYDEGTNARGIKILGDFIH